MTRAATYRLAVAVGWLGAAMPAEAQPSALVTDLSSHLVSITSSFAGTELLLFGAVEGAAGDVVVVVRGPEMPVIVRKKNRLAGIWINREAVEFRRVPGYYAVAATRPLREIASPGVLDRLELGLHRMRCKAVTEISRAQQNLFGQAIVRAKVRENLYRLEIAKVRFLGDTLFRTRVQLPANVPVGSYTALTYLLRDGAVVAAQTSPLFIKKAGVERQIFDFAQNQPLFHGIAAVTLALLAGWLAAVIFRRE